MIYRLCGLDVKMGGKWRRSAWGGDLQRRIRERKERKKNIGERKKTGAAGLSNLFGRWVAEDHFGLCVAENGPFLSTGDRSYYFRPGHHRRHVFGPEEPFFSQPQADDPFLAKWWPKTPFSAHARPTGAYF